MRAIDTHTTQTTPSDVTPVSLSVKSTLSEVLPLGLQDLEQLRLVLRGDSVLDWQQLSLRSEDEAHKLLKLIGIDLDQERDRAQLRSIHKQAIDYLDTQLNHFVSSGVRHLKNPEELLMLASEPGPLRGDACIVLKVMHVVHHVAGRELLYRLPVSTQDLFYQVEQSVFSVIDGMRAHGIKIAQFEGSRKTNSSILTKLLCRSDSLAAEVHDRIRFRVITEDLSGIFEALVYMTRNLFPFNYVLPGESRNDLLDLEASLREDDYLSRLAQGMQTLPTSQAASNPYSAKGFRMINFVVDLPVRVTPEVMRRLSESDLHEETLGNTVFLLVEIQLVDQATHMHNNTGDNRHSLYKERQLKKVTQRLVAEPMPAVEPTTESSNSSSLSAPLSDSRSSDARALNAGSSTAGSLNIGSLTLDSLNSRSLITRLPTTGPTTTDVPMITSSIATKNGRSTESAPSQP